MSKSITTDVVKNVKVNGVYQALNDDLKIKTNHGVKHDIIVCSINRKRKTARVKTITSLESQKNGKWRFINGKLNDVKKGNILLIPNTQLHSSHLSGINHSTKIIPLNKIHYKEKGDSTRFPKRYAKLIHRK